MEHTDIYIYTLDTDPPVLTETAVSAGIKGDKSLCMPGQASRTGTFLPETLYIDKTGKPFLIQERPDIKKAAQQMEKLLTNDYFAYCAAVNREKNKKAGLMRAARHAEMIPITEDKS